MHKEDLLSTLIFLTIGNASLIANWISIPKTEQNVPQK